MDVLSFRLRLLKEGLSTKEILKDYIIVELPLSGKSVKVILTYFGEYFYLEDVDWAYDEDDIIKALKDMDKPPPKPSGIVVSDALISHLKEHHDLCALVKERDAFGRKKYGQPLMSEDGRDGVEDARQEAGDLLQYAFKVYLSGDKDGLEKIRRLVNGVQAVVEELSLSK